MYYSGMTLNEIEKQAKALMTAHGLGWMRFKFDNGKRRIGCCHFSRVDGVWLAHTITLSRHFALLLPADEIRLIILHEIAHAKAGHDAGHGPKWKREARALGIQGDRCHVASERPAPSVTAKCDMCGDKQKSGQHRLPQRIYICPTHRIALTWYKKGRRLSVEEMPQAYRTRYIWATTNGRIPR